MYFPYLRGRQFDLIAIRELLQKDLIGEKIIPIIEPIKLTSTLISTINTFIENERELIIIQNPCVGNFEVELEGHDLYDLYVEQLKNNYITLAHILNSNSEEELKLLTTNLEEDLEDIAIIHNDISLISLYKKIFNDKVPRFNVIPSEMSFRRKLRKKNLVSLKDEFKKQKRNTDYAIKDDEFFSEEHLHYSNEGLIGFSDYSIVGSDFNEGGFAPYAIALHIVYFSYDEEGEVDILRMKHFVSNSNSDIRDPALKFSEALDKLENFYSKIDSKKIDTYALKILLEHNEKGSYPGLPTSKKLSLMHHIELMNGFLEGVE